KGGEGASGGDGRGLNEVISSARQVFLETFLSFSDLLKGAFGLTSDTTKEAVGKRLGKIGEAVNVAKSKLESLKITDNYNVIKTKADGIITKSINTLEKMVNGATKIRDATGSAVDKVANAGSAGDAVQADIESVKGLIAGINLICEAAKDVGTGSNGNANKAITDSKEIGNLFNQTANTNDSKALDGAGRAVSAASGSDILAAIEAVKDQNNVAGNIDAAKNAYDIAISNKSNGNATHVQTNASAIAAGLALRAMAKSGKLATHATNAPGEAVNAVLIGVVGKTVNEIVSTIRRTVDKCLKDINDCIKENSSSDLKST
ncbi:Variable major outer membrane lipoprotein, partial [Borrelia duttonii CR2A]